MNEEEEEKDEVRGTGERRGEKKVGNQEKLEG